MSNWVRRDGLQVPTAQPPEANRAQSNQNAISFATERMIWPPASTSSAPKQDSSSDSEEENPSQTASEVTWDDEAAVRSLYRELEEEPPNKITIVEAITAYKSLRHYLLNQNWGRKSWKVFIASSTIQVTLKNAYLEKRRERSGTLMPPLLMPINIRPSSIEPFIQQWVKFTVRLGHEYRGFVAFADGPDIFQLEQANEYIGGVHIRYIESTRVRFQDVYMIEIDTGRD